MTVGAVNRVRLEAGTFKKEMNAYIYQCNVDGQNVLYAVSLLPDMMAIFPLEEFTQTMFGGARPSDLAIEPFNCNSKRLMDAYEGYGKVCEKMTKLQVKWRNADKMSKSELNDWNAKMAKCTSEMKEKASALQQVVYEYLNGRC